MTLVSSGSPQNAMVRRAGSTSEIDGAVSLDQVKGDFGRAGHSAIRTWVL